MAKININPIVGAYASVTAINDRLSLIEDTLNDNILWRGGFVSEPNTLSVDVDMNGNSLLNLDVIGTTTAGGSIQDGIDWSQEWAINPVDVLISSGAGGNGTSDYSSLHWATKTAADLVLTNADVASTNADVVLTNADVVATDARYKIFDDRYLGAKASAPSTLNDNTTALSAAHEGIEYWNSTSNDRWTWNGTVWGLTSNSVATSANLVSVADAGGYYPGSSDVEAALQELRPDTGNWTPTIRATTDAGTGWTYIVQRGRWTRVGKLMYMSFNLRTTTVSPGASGTLVIEGMPSVNLRDSSDTVGLITNEDTGLSHSSTLYTSFYMSAQTNNLMFNLFETGEGGKTEIMVSSLSGGINIKGTIVASLN